MATLSILILFLNFKLTVQNFVMLNVVMLSVVMLSTLGPYSQHSIFFATYKWAQQARMLHQTRLESLASKKHSSLLCPFASYTAKKEL
jgi:hypothetical protein